MKNTISILGCGWLGLPLAIKLVKNGWKVKGSTTADTKLPILRQNNIEGYLVQLAGKQTSYGYFLASDVLLVNVPPSLKKQPALSYLNQMAALAHQVAFSPVQHVIFISSTSVYKDANAEITSTDDVDEDSPLYQSENIFKQQNSFNTTVIRFAGLIGPGRHPSRFFAGKTNVPNGRAPVNLIHLDDCIAIIEAVLQQQKFGGTYHAAAPTHPSRKEFYTLASQTMGMPMPAFIDELKEWKTINPSKLCNQLGYAFTHPDLLAWVKISEDVLSR